MRSDVPSLQIAFFTGQSDPASCALSAQQRDFLQQLHGDGRQLIASNYPYRSDMAPHRRVALWRASVCNARQYLAARAARVAHSDRMSVQALLAQAPMTVLLAGSCGLQLLTALQLPQDLRARLAVFAYGPVCHEPATFAQLHSVQGRGDWISRALFRGPVQLAPACGHMDYLTTADVLSACQAFVATIQQTLRGRVHAH